MKKTKFELIWINWLPVGPVPPPAGAPTLNSLSWIHLTLFKMVKIYFSQTRSLKQRAALILFSLKSSSSFQIQWKWNNQFVKTWKQTSSSWSQTRFNDGSCLKSGPGFMSSSHGGPSQIRFNLQDHHSSSILQGYMSLLLLLLSSIMLETSVFCPPWWNQMDFTGVDMQVVQKGAVLVCILCCCSR